MEGKAVITLHIELIGERIERLLFSIDAAIDRVFVVRNESMSANWFDIASDGRKIVDSFFAVALNWAFR